MVEVGIICIVVLAVGYWVTLWLMGRHDDVLHGDFVRPDQAGDGAAKSVLPASPFPAKPLPSRRVEVKSVAAEPLLPASSAPPSPAHSDRIDTLQSLLASIKRDLKDASQL